MVCVRGKEHAFLLRTVNSMSSALRKNDSRNILKTEKKGVSNVDLIPSKNVYAHAFFLKDIINTRLSKRIVFRSCRLLPRRRLL